MGMTDREREWAEKARRFIKAEAKRAGVTYAQLAEKLTAHGLEETETSIASKLGRGTFAVTFFLGCLEVLGLGGVHLEDM